MTTLYPAQIDNNISLPELINGVTPLDQSVINRLRDTIIAVEAELGVQPSGSYATVRYRLDIVEGLPRISLAGDLGGTLCIPRVIALQSYPVSNLAPALGNVLTWNGLAWVPAVPTGGGGGGSFIAAGDLSGLATSQVVVGLHGNPLAATTPVQSAVPVYDTSVSRYDVRQLTQDDILPAFAINSFSGGSTVEVGNSVVNPSFTASYTSVPASATISNTDGTDSPLSLTSPFTSGNVIGTFSHNVIASVVFTLTAVAATTKIAYADINFYARSFAGLGTPGATGATASGNSALLAGATGTLSQSGLYSSIVGASFGPFTPTAQKIYLITQHTSSPHTFKDQNGFGFAFGPGGNGAPTTFTFTNQFGATISMDIYESTNLLSTPFTVTAVS